METQAELNNNQRTSCPVNAHLTPGPGIYFNAFIHVYSPRAGAENPLGQNFDNNRKAFSLCPYVASFKMISSKPDFIHIFNDFIHVYSPGARSENPWGQTFDVNRKPLSLRTHLLQVSNKSLSTLILYTFFNVFPHVYSPRARADNPCGQNPDVNRKALLQVSKK